MMPVMLLVMIPLVVNVREIRLIEEVIERGILKAMEEEQVSIPYKVGTMMETPRACLGARRLAPAVEFMSFGTNDLTQMTYGFSRDDGWGGDRSIPGWASSAWRTAGSARKVSSTASAGSMEATPSPFASATRSVWTT